MDESLEREGICQRSMVEEEEEAEVEEEEEEEEEEL